LTCCGCDQAKQKQQRYCTNEAFPFQFPPSFLPLSGSDQWLVTSERKQIRRRPI